MNAYDEKTANTIWHLLNPTHDSEGWHALLATLEAEKAIPVLVQIIDDDSKTRQVRSQAISLLGQLRNERSLPTLIAILGSPDGLLRARAVLALAQLGSRREQVVQLLIDCIRDEDYFVRECAAKSLGHMHCEEGLAALSEMTAHDEVTANREVAHAAIAMIQSKA